MDYKKIIKHILIDKELQQKDIVKNSSMDKKTVSRLLNDKRVTNVNTLIDILDAINCTLYIKDNNDKEYKVDKVKEK